MKANELMIGDWVLTLESTHKEKVYAQIWAIEEGQTSILVKKDNCNWFVDIEWIEPISLTPEILEKNGFDVSDPEVKQYHFEEDGQRYHFSLRQMYNQKDGKPNGYSFFAFGVLTIIDYVHQLQHALRLCGIEKEIEL